MNDIMICIPNYNGAEYLKSLTPIDGVDFVVMDNCSTDDSVLISKMKGFITVENKKNIDRTGNWLRCLKYFNDSNYKWMKWLFIGDKLNIDFKDIITDSINNCEDCSLIVFNYNIVNRKKSICYNWSPNIGVDFADNDAIANYLVNGINPFGSPIGILVSKNAVRNINIDDIKVHNFEWLADVLINYQLTKSGNVKFCNKTIGDFIIDSRKHFTKLNNSLFTQIEELELIRLICKEKKISETEINPKNIRKHLWEALLFFVKNNFMKKIIRRFVNF